MKRIIPTATGILLTAAIPAAAQQGGPWRMHDWMGWGWGGMWFGPLFMLAALAVLVAFVVVLVRWLGGDRAVPSAPRTARDILDERYARGEIDREEYLKRRDDMASRS